MNSLSLLRLTAGSFCLAASFTLAPAAHAQVFTINFAPQTQVLTPGTSETFSGTITNTSTTTAYYVNSDAFGSFPSGLTFDDSAFYNTFAGTLLDAGQTSVLTSLFTVSDTNAAPGIYTQNPYDVYGGTTPDAGDQFGSQVFTITVSNPVPEVSTSLSLGILLAAGAFALTVQRRKRASAL